MATSGIAVSGLREFTRNLERAGVDVEELKDVMGRVASEAADTMQPFVPSRSGKLRASVRGNRAKGKAVVTIGTARVPYAAAIQYGWPARNIKPARFVERTDAVMEDRAVQLLEEGWGDIAERHGLA